MKMLFGFAAAVAAATLATAVRAGDLAGNPALIRDPAGADAVLARLVPPEPGRAACFVRRYDAAHLAAHPRQQVTSVAFLLRFTRLEPGYFSDGPDSRTTLYRYEFGLAATLRGRKPTLYAAGDCGRMPVFEPDPRTGKPRPGTERSAVLCTVEEDGGGIEIDPASGDQLALRFDPLLGRIRLAPAGADETAGIDIGPGADDKAFRLDRAPPEACRLIRRQALE